MTINYAGNADKLDGKDSTEFAPAIHNHDSLYYRKSAVDNKISALEARIAALENKLASL